MKNKPIIPIDRNMQSKTYKKNTTRKPIKTVPKNVLIRRTSIKLRTSTGKCAAKKTRDKAPKLQAATMSQKCSGLSVNKKTISTGPHVHDKPKKVVATKLKDKLSQPDNKNKVQNRGILKAKSRKSSKTSGKKKVVKQLNPDDFLDIWAFVSIGKREASLNASMKVNIMFEKHSQPKSHKTLLKKVDKQESAQVESLAEESSEKGKVSLKSHEMVNNKKGDSEKETKSLKNKMAKEANSLKHKRGETSKEKSCQDSRKVLEKADSQVLKTKLADGDSRKRKSSSVKACKEEPAGKMSKTVQTRKKTKTAKKGKKLLPSGHHLCNIIERSPRQASLVAKAMIALEQEEDVVKESAARTQVYDWTELRPCMETESRKIKWCQGLGRSKKNNDEDLVPKSDKASAEDGGDCMEQLSDTAVVENEALHNTLLRTLHQIGDSRILKEYLRAQREDFQGFVDVEKCSTPEQDITSSDPKKLSSPTVRDEKLDPVSKSTNNSPIKPQPCRVVTPIPQLLPGQKVSNLASFIHNPISQPMYPQHRPLTHPQPIKVTPYPPSPGYIYQYAMERLQHDTYTPPNASPISYSLVNGDVSATRDYQPTYTINHIGRPCLDRRSVNLYQPATYSTPLHLPIQQIGYNYGAYYPTHIHALPQQPVPALQTLPAHQKYPLVQAPLMSQHQDVSQLGSYQHGYPQSYPPPPLTNVIQNDRCMPPPLPPPIHRRPQMSPSRQTPSSGHSFTSIDSLRSLNPSGVELMPPAIDFSPSLVHHHSNNNHHHQFPSTSSYKPVLHYQHPQHKDLNPQNCVPKYSVTCSGLNKPYTRFKKEQEDGPVSSCDIQTKTSVSSNDCAPRTSCSSGANTECSDVSDLLHSAHTTMYQIEGISSAENIREFQQTQVSVSCDSTKSSPSPFKINFPGQASFSASYSVSSILDMPSFKVKTELENRNNSASSHPSESGTIEDLKIPEQPSTSHSIIVCLASGGSKDGGHSQGQKDGPVNSPQKNNSSDERCNKIVKQEDTCGDFNPKGVIVIDDSDASSDDEPLARLVKSKLSDEEDHHLLKDADSQIRSDTDQPTKTSQAQQSKIKIKEKKSRNGGEKISLESSRSKHTTSKAPSSVNTKHIIHAKPECDSLLEENQPKPPIVVPDKEDVASSNKDMKKSILKKSYFSSGPKTKKSVVKTKNQPEGPEDPHRPNTNHGWTWLGEGRMRPIPKVTQTREEPVRIRKCYKSMQHTLGEIVSVKDCVILQSDGDGSIPYVAKVSALWENLNGEMMFSMLWYYQPEHTAMGREPEDGEQELFASKHREENSVACIDDKCFVLMYNEYCRLEAEGVRQQQGIALPRWREQIAEVTAEDKQLCRLPPPASTCAENIWFCRYDYDVRKKIVKKPKHKKSNLRYRAPCKLV